MASNFSFETQKEQSAVKTDIVIKYFSAWASILSNRHDKIAYIDLFAGPGIYEDGTKSTPIIITEHILTDPKLTRSTVLYFNEKDPVRFDQLKSNINSIPRIDKLRFSPAIHNNEIDYDTPKHFMKAKIPAFCFLDPAGYKGLSLELIRSFGKDHGTDVIFFFNYNDINRAITNPHVTEDMAHLFGPSRYASLLKKLPGQTGQNRESIIINEMSEAVRDIGMHYVLPFRFKFAGKNRTSHYLIFASKNGTAFRIMKDIMYKAGEQDMNGIGRFEFIPSCDKSNYVQLSIIDFYNAPFEDLKNRLCQKYAGRTFTVDYLIESDLPYTPFVGKQYKEALKQLECEGRIRCNPAASDRRKNTMGDTVKVTF